jgi:hypothetical protein
MRAPNFWQACRLTSDDNRIIVKGDHPSRRFFDRFRTKGLAVRKICDILLTPSMRGTPPMSLESHLSELQRRHQLIADQIQEEEKSPATDDIRLHELKRKKLLLKDEIEKIKHETLATAH